MKNWGAKLTATAAAILTVFALSSCAAIKSASPEYTNKEQTEQAQIEERRPGTIDYDFMTPPTLEDKAVSKTDNIGRVLDNSDLGILAISTDDSRLYRIINGEPVWSTVAQAEGEFVDASFVRSIGRSWIVTARKTAEGTLTVEVYDAYAYGNDQGSLRKRSFPNGSMIINELGVMVQSEGKYFKYYPDSGLTSEVALQEGNTLLAPTSTGYLVSYGNRVGLATTAENKGWDSKSDLPEGFTNAATNRMVGFSSSLVALEWTEGNDNALTFHNLINGEKVGENTSITKFPDNYLTEIKFAENQTLAHFDSYTLDVSTRELEDYDFPIIGIIDNVVYLSTGAGMDASEKKPVWKANSSFAPLLGFSQRQALYIEDNALYLINLKHVLSAPTRTTPVTSGTSSPESEDGSGD